LKRNTLHKKKAPKKQQLAIHTLYLYDQVGPLGAQLKRLEGIGDVGAVEDQLHDENAVFVVVEAVDHVLGTSTEGFGVLSMNLKEQLYIYAQ
jgi:hypothetical protein